MKLALRRERKKVASGQIDWVSCKPFLDNKLAVLIHRPLSVRQHKLGMRGPHLGIQLWCGNCVSGDTKFTFLDVPPEGKIVCWRCEVEAIAANLPSSDEIVGRHVHIGGVKAFTKCCQIKGEING